MEYLAIETQDFYTTFNEHGIRRDGMIFTLQDGGTIYHVDAKRVNSFAYLTTRGIESDIFDPSY